MKTLIKLSLTTLLVAAQTHAMNNGQDEEQELARAIQESKQHAELEQILALSRQTHAHETDQKALAQAMAESEKEHKKELERRAAEEKKRKDEELRKERERKSEFAKLAQKTYNPKLIAACKANNFSEMRSSILAGADVNTRDEFGCTPLALTAYNGKLLSFDYLMGSAADINARADNGTTILMEAAYGSPAIFAIVLHTNPDLDQVNNRGETIFDIIHNNIPLAGRYPVNPDELKRLLKEHVNKTASDKTLAARNNVQQVLTQATNKSTSAITNIIMDYYGNAPHQLADDLPAPFTPKSTRETVNFVNPDKE